jgi:aspartyl-tRNA(Asn)/glutamyl-tRNA(Gln) amidotransferase subunit C
MKKEEVAHLAKLARIKVTEEELSELENELSSIVSYVSAVSEIVAEGDNELPQIGPVYNVFRADEVTNEADEYTANLLGEMPETEGRYMKVQKILKNDE